MKKILIILLVLVYGCTKNYYIYITPEKIVEYKEFKEFPFPLIETYTPPLNSYYKGDLHGYIPYGNRLLWQMDSLIKK